MTEQKKNKPPAAICKRTIMLSFLFLVVIFSLLYLLHYRNDDIDNYNKKAIEVTLEKYEAIKKIEISDHLNGNLVEIIKGRKECFLSQIPYFSRNKKCNKDYINKIFELARDDIKSAPSDRDYIQSEPMLGLFVRCLQECPIYGSLCNGEEGSSEQECIDMEARCIEYCLDENWRGGNFQQYEMYYKQ